MGREERQRSAGWPRQELGSKEGRRVVGGPPARRERYLRRFRGGRESGEGAVTAITWRRASQSELRGRTRTV